jgi:hypothetical protein
LDLKKRVIEEKGRMFVRWSYISRTGVEGEGEEREQRCYVAVVVEEQQRSGAKLELRSSPLFSHGPISPFKI